MAWYFAIAPLSPSLLQLTFVTIDSPESNRDYLITHESDPFTTQIPPIVFHKTLNTYDPLAVHVAPCMTEP